MDVDLRRHAVPADVGEGTWSRPIRASWRDDLEPRVETTYATAEYGQATCVRSLLALLEEDLKSETDAEVGRPSRDSLHEHVAESTLEGTGERAERSLAGNN